MQMGHAWSKVYRRVVADGTPNPRTLVSKMTKWLKSVIRCARSVALESLAYDMTVPEWQKSVELIHASNVSSVVGKSCSRDGGRGTEAG